jgi:hypothetical protein
MREDEPIYCVVNGRRYDLARRLPPHRWRTSPHGTRWQNVFGYNVAIIKEPNAPGKWNYRIEDPEGKQTWKDVKCSIAEIAMRPALEGLAEIL